MNTFSPLPKRVFDDAIALDTADHVFNMHADATYPAILFFVFLCQFAPSRLFLWLQNRDAFWGEALKARVLAQQTSLRKVIRFTVDDAFVMPFAFPGSTQTAHAPTAIRDHHVLDGVLPLLSAVIPLLFIGVTRPIYRSFSSIMEKKGVPCTGLPSDSGTVP